MSSTAPAGGAAVPPAQGGAVPTVVPTSGQYYETKMVGPHISLGRQLVLQAILLFITFAKRFQMCSQS